MIYLVTLCILVENNSWMHGSVHGFRAFHLIFLEKFHDVLLLMNVDTIISLLYLQSKENFQFSHHTHFKLILHHLRELFTELFISSKNNYISNIYLYYCETNFRFFLKIVVSTFQRINLLSIKNELSLSYHALGFYFKPINLS